MKSIGANTLLLSVLILLTALSNNVNKAEESPTTTATTVKSTSSGNIRTSTDVPSTIKDNIIKTENGSTPTPTPALSTRPSDVTKTNLTITPDPADNQTENGTEAITKVSTTTDQNLQANASSSVISNVTLTTGSFNDSTPNHVEVQTTDAGQNNLLQTPEVSSDAIPTEYKDILKDKDKGHEDKDKGHEEQPTLKSKQGIFIGVGGILAAVVLVVLLFLYKMCQKKPPAPENSDAKASAQTNESVKLLSVKTATPYSDSKRMSSNQMESIEC